MKRNITINYFFHQNSFNLSMKFLAFCSEIFLLEDSNAYEILYYYITPRKKAKVDILFKDR